MAKKSKIVKNQQRHEVVARYAERRAELRAVVRDPAASPDAKARAQSGLQRLPRDPTQHGSPVGQLQDVTVARALRAALTTTAVERAGPVVCAVVRHRSQLRAIQVVDAGG